MAQRLAELCTILIEDAHGELAAQIFSTLAGHGRLSFPHLQYYSRIPLRRLLSGIAVLSQHHLIHHHASYDDVPTNFTVNWQAAYVLVRVHKIARLVEEREGEAASSLVASILQLGHVSVVDLACDYDLDSPPKQDSVIDTVEEHMTEEGMTNGIAKDHQTTSGKVTSVSTFHNTLRSLLERGYLLKVSVRSLLAQTDLEQQITETVKKEQFPDGKVTGPKKSKELLGAVTVLKRKWHDEDAYSKTSDIGARGVIKHSQASPSSNKRVKLNDGLPNGTHDDDEDDTDHPIFKLPNDMVVRVNFSKCHTMLRNQRLEKLAHRFHGPVTGAVYGALVRTVEGKVVPKPDTMKPRKVVEDEEGDDCDDDDETLPSATDFEVMKNLDESIDLASTVKGAYSMNKLPNGVGGCRSKPQTVDDEEARVTIKEEDHSDDEHDSGVNGFTPMKQQNGRLKLVSMHLDLLAEHSKPFLVRDRRRNESRVNFDAITRTVIQTELDAMVYARFSKPLKMDKKAKEDLASRRASREAEEAREEEAEAQSGKPKKEKKKKKREPNYEMLHKIAPRVVRMLREKGKLEEKQISTMCMMHANDVRAILTLLQFHGICDVQEVPKDGTRQPSRTTYLWCLEEQKVQDQYLDRTYHAISRTLQRVRFEREGKYKAVIEKAERADVRGREQELLSPGEKKLLQAWRDVEEQLMVQISRLDDLVALLRDFGGNDTSLTT